MAAFLIIIVRKRDSNTVKYKVNIHMVWDTIYISNLHILSVTCQDELLLYLKNTLFAFQSKSAQEICIYVMNGLRPDVLWWLFVTMYSIYHSKTYLGNITREK